MSRKKSKKGDAFGAVLLVLFLIGAAGSIKDKILEKRVEAAEDLKPVAEASCTEYISRKGCFTDVDTDEDSEGTYIYTDDTDEDDFCLSDIYDADAPDVPALQNDYSYAHGYYYDFLNPAEQKTYDYLYEMLDTFSESIEFPAVSFSEFWNARDAVGEDHPEFYWTYDAIRSYSYEDGRIYKAANLYPESAGSDLEYMNGIASEVTACIAGLSEYDSYAYIYNYINTYTQYGKAEGVDDQTISGVFLHGLAVCAGYSRAFKFLCDKAGLFCINVYGDSYNYDMTEGGPHVWNMIRVDGSYYWVDVTWGDTEMERTDHMYADPGYYNYLCATDETFLKRHVIAYDMKSGDPGHFIASYPPCVDETYTVYSLMDLQFTSYEDAYCYIHGNLADNIPYLWMQFDNTYELDRAVADLCSSGGLWNYVREEGVSYSGFNYFPEDEFNTLVIEFV